MPIVLHIAHDPLCDDFEKEGTTKARLVYSLLSLYHAVGGILSQIRRIVSIRENFTLCLAAFC